MSDHSQDISCSGRRQFLKQLSAAALAGIAASGSRPAAAGEPAAGLPMIDLGKHRVSRLVAGSNPIHGYSYMGPHSDRHMREYFTVEQTVEFLLDCEREGINTFQFSPGNDMLETLAELRRRGSRMQLICLHSDRAGIADTVQASGALAMVHHGGATDRLFAQGRQAEVRDYVKAAHDAGVLAGVSAHNPDCIQRIADEGWEVDFFMTCFYFLTRALVPETKASVESLATLQIAYPFYKRDPEIMTRVIRQVDQPCLAFKILAAGRLCTSQESVKAAFEFAFQKIKPTDGVIVGMYPRFFDEIQANAGYTRELAV